MIKKSETRYYCIDCEQLLYTYEQGLCCSCDQPWETEVFDENDYPDKWKRVRVNMEIEFLSVSRKGF